MKTARLSSCLTVPPVAWRGTTVVIDVMGSYEILEGNRISFGRGMASTMMACPDMEIADRFNEVINTVDNYTVADGVLSLNKARMAPLARFKLVTE